MVLVRSDRLCGRAVPRSAKARARALFGYGCGWQGEACGARYRRTAATASDINDFGDGVNLPRPCGVVLCAYATLLACRLPTPNGPSARVPFLAMRVCGPVDPGGLRFRWE
jgi:hypothetical protein